MSIHPSVGGVTTIQHALIRGGENLGLFNSDLIFVDDIPRIVIEWAVLPDGYVPALTIPLDPQYLHKVGRPNAEYLYEFPVEDPRRHD